MQEERGGLRAEAVLPGCRHPVDSYGFVDVLDAVLDGAHVRIGQSVTVSEVHSDACPHAVSLQTTHTLYGSICTTPGFLQGTKTSGDSGQLG